LEELEGLAQTAGTRVVGHLTQRRDAPDAATYLGKGKVDELKCLADSADADLVIFDNDLSPGQTRNLEQALGIKVLDRTELILDIFDARTVSLVGYTNAGKSTLLNSLTGADLFTQDALFATLDTRTRRWQLPGWGPVLLSDTVGFIRDLPHHLIASFKATLEEARQADLLLHVADASSPAVYDQIASAHNVLEEIGIEAKSTLLVANKIDALPGRARLDGFMSRYPNAVPISARTGQGLSQLAVAVSEALSRSFLDVDVETGVENGRLMAYLADHGEVLSKKYNGTRVVLHCRIPQAYLGRIQEEGTVIRPRGNESASESSGEW
jgi:GTP-binding protein HflX